MKKIMFSGLLAFSLFLFLLPNAHASSVQGWKIVNNNWYYYNANHDTYKGWLLDNGAWYYLDIRNGEMKIGWQRIGGSWYFFNKNGAMKTGWLLNGGSWYLLGKDGRMKAGWAKEEGKWYYLDYLSGKMKTGWVLLQGHSWYYLDTNGVMKTGWLKKNSKWYYMDSSGKMKTNFVKIGDSWYWFENLRRENEGVMKTGWFYSSRTSPIDLGYYYAYPNGKIAIDTLVNGYYVDSTGLYLQAPALEETVKQLEPVARTYGAIIDVDYYISGLNHNENLDIKLLINGKSIVWTSFHFRDVNPRYIGGDKLNTNILIDSAIAMGCPLEKEKLTDLINQVSGGSLSEGGVTVHNTFENYISIRW